MPRSKDESPIYPKSGEILCGYQLGKTLGVGAFGKVKLATKIGNNDNTEYAVKFIDKSQMDDLDDVERIYRESAILTSLKHPNIIRLYEVLDTTDWVLIIMEYADGGELKDFISSKPNAILPEHLAADIFNSTLNGLEYCHRRKVIHRDLKLENILIDTNGTIKIADFGLSNTIQFGKKMNTSCGTPSYIAPEIIRGDFNKHSETKSSGAECDIWSLGVILYSMICGFLPFQASNIKELYNKILKADYTIPDYLSPQSKALITAMLTIDIEKRITLSQIRNHPWTQMRFNGLIETIKTHKAISNKQIQAAALYNMTRKKAKPTFTEKKRTPDSKSEEGTSQTTIRLKQKDGSRSGAKPSIKHSKSLDRELAVYLKGKTRNSPKNKAKTMKNKTSKRKSAITSLKHKLIRLKMSKQISKTPREKNKKKSSKKDKNEKVRTTTPPNRKNKKKQLKECTSTNQQLKTPNTKIEKRIALHSPIVDSIMRRKPNLSASGAWKDKYTGYTTSRKRTVL